jgi:predicted GIY-YIG superfamily endonuclease
VDTLLARLGKHTTGKGCLYIKSLAEVDVKVLETLLRRAVASRRTQRTKEL